MRRTEDYYSRLARQKGFPARSVYKLEEMQKRFRILRPGDRILDLGAAPGSWSLFCLELPRTRVVAVDPAELAIRSPRQGALVFLQGSLFDPAVVERALAQGPFQVVLSDAAPATSGSSLVDGEASLEIARRALEIAAAGLQTGGNLVVKVFQSGGESELLARMKHLFARARTFKPEASRRESREVYLLGLCLATKGPKKT